MIKSTIGKPFPLPYQVEANTLIFGISTVIVKKEMHTINQRTSNMVPSMTIPMGRLCIPLLECVQQQCLSEISFTSIVSKKTT